MKLYSVNEKGDLTKNDKLDFIENESYIVDDDNTIYIWIGKAVSVDHKDITVKAARGLNKQEKSKNAKLILLDQGQEYGSFLFLKEILKEGVPSEETIEERGKFELKEPTELVDAKPEEVAEQMNDVIQWLEQLKDHRTTAPVKKPKEREEEPLEIGTELDLKSEINMAAYFLSKEGNSYNDLCWLVAEKQLQIQQAPDTPKEDEIRTKAEEVFISSCSYDELCWLLGELKVYEDHNYFEMF